MVFKDYYKILELKTNKLSTEEIKNAYPVRSRVGGVGKDNLLSFGSLRLRKFTVVYKNLFSNHFTLSAIQE